MGLRRVEARGLHSWDWESRHGDGVLVSGAIGGVRSYLPCCAAPEEQGAGDGVGSVESGGRDGDEVFEHKARRWLRDSR